MSSTDLRIGFVLPNNWGIDDVGAIVDLAREAEDLGLDSIWVNHHVVNVGYIADRLGQAPYHDALTVLTAAAMVTERVKLGTSVLVMPYLHPLATAKALATLDQLSDGRVIAGVGVGSLPEENAILGVEYEHRGQLGDEFIDVMTRVWSDDHANHAGDFYSFEQVVAAPKPRQAELPVWIGGSGGPAQRRAISRGQGWHPLVSLDGFRRRMAVFDQRLADAGRPRQSVVVAPRIDISELSDTDAAERWADAGADELVVSASGMTLDAHRDALRAIATRVR